MGVGIHAVDSRGDLALHKAALGGSISIVRFTLEKGANINAWSLQGETPLHYTVIRCTCGLGGRFELTKLLLGNGADICALDGGRSTPLHVAVDSGSCNVVELLLERGSDINARDIAGMTPLANAAHVGPKNKMMVKLLVDNGASIDARLQPIVEDILFSTVA